MPSACGPPSPVAVASLPPSKGIAADIAPLLPPPNARPLPPITITGTGVGWGLGRGRHPPARGEGSRLPNSAERFAVPAPVVAARLAATHQRCAELIMSRWLHESGMPSRQGSLCRLLPGFGATQLWHRQKGLDLLVLTLVILLFSLTVYMSACTGTRGQDKNTFFLFGRAAG
jgi:hypothetical protein